jgi:hypothetical protein
MHEPGWYPDPGGSGQSRFWNGSEWTHDLRPAQPTGSPGADPTRAVAEERSAGDRARTALIVGAGAQIVLYVVMAFVYGALFRDLMDQIERASRTRRGTTATTTMSGEVLAGSMVINVIQIVVLIVGIVFLLWQYQAAKNARALGIPARLPLYWAWLGWLVPIVNLWFPYRVAADCLPPGHPARRIVGWWWGCYLAMGFSAVLVMLASFASVGLALAIVVLPAALAVVAAMRGREMITAIGEHHAELVGSSGPDGALR